MTLVVRLAIADLLRDRLFLICNIAGLAGVLVPLLVLFGVKNGVYDSLIGRLLSNPATLQIDTAGNNAFSQDDVALLSSWPEVGFATGKTRSLFDFVNVRPEGGGRLRDAILAPSGLGDPTLPEGLELPFGSIAVSAMLASQLELIEGSEVSLVTQAEDRPRQLLLSARVVAVLPPEVASGRAVLAGIDTLDLVEAFYDAYALPEHGITEGRDLADRVPSYEGLRVYARSLEELAALQSRIETQFGVRTEARTREVASVLGLGRNLNLALGLTASVASLGLAAALIFGFWSDVARKRIVLATIGLLGVGGRAMGVFPVVQALVTAVLGLAVSFALYGAAAQVATALFGGGLPDGASLTVISGGEVLAICALVIALVTLAASFAARAASRLDPATVLREGT